MRTTALAEVLRTHWGYDNFLPLQAEAMDCALRGRDSLVVLPTGGGKSLCFQAPAMCLDGLTLVVSPLIALMKDQVDTLRACGVPAAQVNSALSARERRRVADQVRAGCLRLLYLAPERLLTDETLEFLQTRRIAQVAVDEAHCISSWGHDFRPEYRGLSVLKEVFPRTSIHAFTATATEVVRHDIAQQLRLEDPCILVGSFDRPNLVFKVQRRVNRLEQICEVLNRHPNESGIIYCISRKDVDTSCLALRELGYRVLPYHAGMNDEDRRRNQEAFLAEEVDTVIATVAFGMGIDKSNVRYVIHAGMPKSVEQYQQESGRAGRDGLEAECCLFYSGQDYTIWRRVIEQSEPAARDGALRSLNTMMDFCAGVQCRHQAIVEHFGQQFDGTTCDACDVCLGQLDLVDDPATVGRQILSCVLRLEERFGGDYTAKVLHGSREQKITRQDHHQLSTWGLLAGEHLRTIRDWIEQLVSQGFLVKEGAYNVLHVTQRGRQLLKGELAPRLLRPATAGSARDALVVADSWHGVDRGLFDELRRLRQELAAAQDVPAYVVFGDATLRELARCRPSNPDGFRAIRGVGKAKLADFATAFISRIAAYCRANDVTMDIQPTDSAPARRGRTQGGPSMAAVGAFQYFRQGLSVEQVAQQMNRAVSTTYGYLIEYIRHEGIVEPAPWVDTVTALRILQAVRQVGDQALRPVFDLLEGKVPYEKIRVVLQCNENSVQCNENSVQCNENNVQRNENNVQRNENNVQRNENNVQRNENNVQRNEDVCDKQATVG